jgi:hypothetical protein
MSGTEAEGTEDADVTAPRRAGLELVIVSGDSDAEPIALPPGRFLIGSGRRCNVVLALPGVLPRHAEGRNTPHKGLWVRGLRPGSAFVNGAAANDWTQLRAGDFLKLRGVELAVRERGDTDSPSGTLRALNPREDQPTRLHGSASPSAGLEETLVRTGTHHAPSPTEPVAGASFLRPDTLIADRYRIVSRIAAGGMGEVYKVEHVELARAFALKVMRPELSSSPEFVKRFKREAVASSRIGHQNIVDITDFGSTSDGRFYYVMELLEGQTLAALIAQEGAQPIPRVMRIAFQMAHALSAAHRLGIVHRDLKPENVMLLQRQDQLDLVKVVDFGIAKVASGQGAGGHTTIGKVVGTPQYMAPEQAAGLDVDAVSDIYAFGLILHELITGRPVFTGKTPSILMSLQMTAPPPPLTAGAGSPIPPRLAQLILAMLEKNPKHRPQSTEDLLEVLEAIRRRRRQMMLQRPR